MIAWLKPPGRQREGPARVSSYSLDLYRLISRTAEYGPVCVPGR